MAASKKSDSGHTGPLSGFLPVVDTGLEVSPDSPQETAISETGGAESGAVDARNGLNDPALVSLVEAWPTLPQTVRDEIAAIVLRATNNIERTERPAMECINLQQQFGTRYCVTFDAAYSPKYVPRNKLAPWSMQLPCERGIVYPHGGDLLAVEVEGRRVTANRLRHLDCTTTYQEGDSLGAVTFHAADFDEVATIVKPRRKRQVSEAERQRLAAIGFQQTTQSGQVSGPVDHLEASA